MHDEIIPGHNEMVSNETGQGFPMITGTNDISLEPADSNNVHGFEEAVSACLLLCIMTTFEFPWKTLQCI